jgi:hypothetical protein
MHPLLILGLGGLALLVASSSKASAPETKATGYEPINVPLEIATRALKMSGVDGRAQIVWLNDNGWIHTASALDRFFSGEAKEADVLKVATDEWSARLAGKNYSK